MGAHYLQFLAVAVSIALAPASAVAQPLSHRWEASLGVGRATYRTTNNSAGLHSSARIAYRLSPAQSVGLTLAVWEFTPGFMEMGESGTKKAVAAAYRYTWWVGEPLQMYVGAGVVLAQGFAEGRLANDLAEPDLAPEWEVDSDPACPGLTFHGGIKHYVTNMWAVFGEYRGLVWSQPELFGQAGFAVDDESHLLSQLSVGVSTVF